MRKFLLLLRMENTEEENNFYIKAITQYGGEVLLVRDTDTKDELITVLEQVEGILLPGGNDVGKWDYFLIDYVVSHQLKLLKQKNLVSVSRHGKNMVYQLTSPQIMSLIADAVENSNLGR